MIDLSRIKYIENSDTMDVASALQIVIDLARKQADTAYASHADFKTINDAIGIVEDMAMNQFGDD